MAARSDSKCRDQLKNSFIFIVTSQPVCATYDYTNQQALTRNHYSFFDQSKLRIVSQPITDMKSTAKKLGGAGLALLFLGAATLQAQNLLTDPGFETSSGWTLFNGAAYSANFARTGTMSMLDATVNNVPGSFEAFASAPGLKYDLTGYGFTPTALAGSPAFGLIQLDFFSGPNATGTDLGTVETSPGTAKGSAQVNGSSVTGQWISLDTGIATAPAGTQSVAAYTIYVDFSGNNQGVYFDDLNLEAIAVPEPSTFALMATGFLGAFAMWRRRK